MAHELVEGVYDITCAERETGRIRAFLFDDGTLVDCGLPDTTDALVDGIDATPVEPERLVITHADGDHVGGFDTVVRDYWVDTYVPEGADLDTEFDPDHRYGDGDEVGPFEAVHVPGHRDHQHALINEDDDIAVLADAVSGADQRGLPEGYFHLPPGVYTDDLNQAEESLERLLDYQFNVGLVYHGSSVLSGASWKLEEYVYRAP
ncbi:MBL fold metallo-hydrolase [Natronomonas amylolytica]|uniref:MBL fold metallo-hydrolase n=1 Tax=Natronomonas amylolytica TaxID=3108498 RepID=UPI00300A9D6E